MEPLEIENLCFSHVELLVKFHISVIYRIVLELYEIVGTGDIVCMSSSTGAPFMLLLYNSEHQGVSWMDSVIEMPYVCCIVGRKLYASHHSPKIIDGRKSETEVYVSSSLLIKPPCQQLSLASGNE